jgi:hypothetical protein
MVPIINLLLQKGTEPENERTNGLEAGLEMAFLIVVSVST